MTIVWLNWWDNHNKILARITFPDEIIFVLSALSVPIIYQLHQKIFDNSGFKKCPYSDQRNFHGSLLIFSCWSVVSFNRLPYIQIYHNRIWHFYWFIWELIVFISLHSIVASKGCFIFSPWSKDFHSYLEAYLLLISRGCTVFSIIIKCFPFSFKFFSIFSYFFGHCIARCFILFSPLIKGFGIIIWKLIDLNPLYLFYDFLLTDVIVKNQQLLMLLSYSTSPMSMGNRFGLCTHAVILVSGKVELPIFLLRFVL